MELGVIVLVLLLAFAGGRTPSGGGGGGQLGGSGKRPPGNPPGGCETYDTLWFPDRASVLQAFASMGYNPPDDRMTMNDPGPDGSLGGGDDLPSNQVFFFQGDYNAASEAGILGPNAGGLDQDGFVGPCTLNGLQHAMMVVGPDDWRGTGGTTVSIGGG